MTLVVVLYLEQLMQKLKVFGILLIVSYIYNRNCHLVLALLCLRDF